MITLFWTVVFCLGLNICLSDGNILYFIRKPFVSLEANLDNKKLHYLNFHPDMTEVIWYWLSRLLLFILTPVILCITCMASVWGTIVFVLLEGFNDQLIVPLVLNCVAASFIQTFIWSLYVKYIQ